MLFMESGVVVLIAAAIIILVLAVGLVRSNRRLAQSEGRYRALAESTSDWIWEVDTQRRYTYVSPMVETFLGYKPEEVLGRTPFDFMPPEEAERISEIFAGIEADKRQFSNLENINLHKSGWQVVLESSGVPVLGASGELLGYRGIDRDITERKHAEQMLIQYREQLEDQVVSRTIELSESKNQLDSIIENLPAVFYIKDAQGRYLRGNRSFEEVTGIARSQIIGHSDEEIFPDSLIDLFEDEDYSVFSTATPSTYETAVKLLDESKRDYLTTKLPLFDGQGAVNGLMGISTDITIVKQLQWDLAILMNRLKQRVSLEQLVSSITSRMIGVEPQMLGGEIEAALAKIGKFTEADRCYLIQIDSRGDNFSITHQWCASGVSSTISYCQNIPRDSQMYMLERLDYGMALDINDVDSLPAEAQALRQLMDSCSTRAMLMLPVIYGGYLRGAIGLDSLQIKAGWNAEDLDLLKTQAVLLGQVLQSHENQRALRDAKDEAERLARVKSEFLANMSHEIRTPLNAVLGLAQIGVRTSAGRKGQESFQRILDAGQHLLGLVNDVLDFSKFEAGKFTLERVSFNLGDVIDRSVNFIADRVYGRGLDMEVHEPLVLPEQLEGDPMRLTQVLGNLLGNAVKFTAHGQIVLSVVIEGETLIIAVQDSGIGMTAEQISRLFTPFEQADSSITRRFGGSGLGLAISDRLVRAMGGSINVASEVDVGTRFEVRLPLVNSVAHQNKVQYECTVIHLLGLSERDIEAVSAWSAAQGITVNFPRSLDALPLPLTDRLLLTDAVLQNEKIYATVVDLLNQNGNVMVLARPGEESSRLEGLCGRVTVVEEPLRLRHLLRAMGDANAAPLNVAGQSRLAGLHILAVEDTETNRLILQDLLDQEGGELVFAENGQQALNIVKMDVGETFDLVLMDIQMPVMDGYEATRQLRKLRPQLPVIGLTAHAFTEDRQRCIAVGMVDHVSKPIEIEMLVSVILKHLPEVRRNLPHVAAARKRESISSICAEMPLATDALIDWIAFYDRYRGRRAFMQKLLTSVCNSNQETLKELHQAVAEQNFERLVFLAHGVKGTAGNLMAPVVFELSEATEMAARREAPESFALGAELADLLAKLLALLADKLKQWEVARQKEEYGYGGGI